MRVFQAWQSGNRKTDKHDVRICWGIWHGHKFIGLGLESFDQRKHPAGAIKRKQSNTTMLTMHGRSCRSLVLSICFCQTVRNTATTVQRHSFRARNWEGPGYYGRKELGCHSNSLNLLCYDLFLTFSISNFPTTGLQAPHSSQYFLSKRPQTAAAWHQWRSFWLKGLHNPEPKPMKPWLPSILNEML